MALHYKGYSGTADYSAEDGVYFGHVTGIPDGVTYEGETLEALGADFRGAVDTYLRILWQRKAPPRNP